MPPKREDFESRITQTLNEASQAGRSYLDLKPADLHHAVGYPAPTGNHRVPLCCAVMRAAMISGGRVVSAPPSGQGASLRIRFRLPREADERSAERRIDRPTVSHRGPKDGTARQAPPERPAHAGTRRLAPGARVALVSCVKLKRASPSPARDLYVSPLFRARCFGSGGEASRN